MPSRKLDNLWPWRSMDLRHGPNVHDGIQQTSLAYIVLTLMLSLAALWQLWRFIEWNRREHEQGRSI